MLKSWKIKYSCPNCENASEGVLSPRIDGDGRQLPCLSIPELRCCKCDDLPVMLQSKPKLIEPSVIVKPSFVPPPVGRMNQ
jgi:hypothetical protein